MRIEKGAAYIAVAAMFVGACAGSGTLGDSQDADSAATNLGEQSESNPGGLGRDEDGVNGETGEESGTELALSERYDAVRSGARLVMAYDSASNSFNGTVENTTNATLARVRVEVHLSNGTELGPTTPTDLDPGDTLDVTLTATADDFDRWTAHPEVGVGEAGGDGEEHGEEEAGGEHQEGTERGDSD